MTHWNILGRLHLPYMTLEGGFQCLMFAFFKHPSCPSHWSNCCVWLSSPSRLLGLGNLTIKLAGTVTRIRAQTSEWRVLQAPLRTKCMALDIWALNRTIFSLLSQSWAYSTWGLQLHSHGLHVLWAHLQSLHSGDGMRKIYPVSHQALHLHLNQRSSDILYNGALHTVAVCKKGTSLLNK